MCGDVLLTKTAFHLTKRSYGNERWRMTGDGDKVNPETHGIRETIARGKADRKDTHWTLDPVDVQRYTTVHNSTTHDGTLFILSHYITNQQEIVSQEFKTYTHAIFTRTRHHSNIQPCRRQPLQPQSHAPVHARANSVIPRIPINLSRQK